MARVHLNPRLVPTRVCIRWLLSDGSPHRYILAGFPVISPHAGMYPLASRWLVPTQVYIRWLPGGWFPH
eukprot:2284247-Pyramimonas_sp.AAC.1